ncbi:MAG: SRPBCC domain-containing protein [Crocinitomicaceae bacterium]|nr:SRPBCC domain-containing protein [Crocinitomicaceae bacterium]
MKTKITVETIVKVPVQKAWEVWSQPHHIINWNFASPDWHCPKAENDLQTGGNYSWTMAAKDGSMSFDFGGTYSKVELHKKIESVLEDKRNVQVEFLDQGQETRVIETFEAEDQNPIDMQRMGWQAILDNYKNYAESLVQLTKMKFDISINASVEKVYQTMLADEHYRVWTAPFHPGSYFKGSWEKGSKMLFLGPDGKGSEGGMVSRIEENIPNKFISIEHLGLVQGDKEITSGPEVAAWAGSHENYSFESKNSSTVVSVELDMQNEFKEMFEGMWPKAIQILKDICEK